MTTVEPWQFWIFILVALYAVETTILLYAIRRKIYETANSIKMSKEPIEIIIHRCEEKNPMKIV